MYNYFIQKELSTLQINLQDFDMGLSPPKIGIEDKYISIGPKSSMLFNGMIPNYPFR